MRTQLYFNSIDEMPLYNWRKCQLGEYEYTRKTDEGNSEDDVKAWSDIYDSFLKEFGLNESYKDILNLKRRIAIIECDLILGAPKSLENQKVLLELELEEIINRKSDGDMDTVIIHIERWRKIEVNEHTTTVRKFYKLLGEYEKYVQEMRTKTLSNG